MKIILILIWIFFICLQYLYVIKVNNDMNQKYKKMKSEN